MTTETNSGKRVQWGVLGAARILRRTMPGLKATNNADLVAIASRDEAKAKSAALQWGASRTYSSYQDLLNASEIDAVYIPLPNGMHFEWIMKAIEAGKHVLCEKPMVLNHAEVEQIQAAATRKSVNVMEAFMYRFHPQQTEVRQMLADGAIGDLRVLRGSYAFPMVTNTYNYRLDSSQGGGATWDVGCYGINVARWMFGSEPKRVWAEGTIAHGVDMDVAAVLDFEGGRRAVLDYGLTYGRRSFYELIGNGGTIAVENMWQEPDVPGYIYLRDDKGLTTKEVPLTNHFMLEVQAFSQAILDKQPAPYPLSDSEANVRVCEAILQSVHSGQPVELV